MARIAHCLDNRLRDGGNIVRPTHRPPSTPQKRVFVSGTHICQRMSKPQGLAKLEEPGKFKKNQLNSQVSNLRPSGF
jgi:hypothetical protein